MKYIMQLTAVLSMTFCLTMLVVLSADAQGEGLRQPMRLLAALQKVSVKQDTSVTLMGCCDGGGCDGGDSCCGGGSCGSGCCCESICCPRCVVGEVEKKCWNVKCKYVCVPSFRWPWECRDKSKRGCDDGCDASCGCAEDSCCGGDTCCGDGCCGEACGSCPAKCGRVRAVFTLEQHKYTCKECGYEWDIKCACRSQGKKHR